MSTATTDTEAMAEAIAAKHLGIETLETLNWDTADFHEVSVWEVKAALIAAFEAGRSAGRAAR
jgi:hypothetical protein